MAAVGNDGPYHSTVNNPADLPEVLAVGSLSPSLLPSSFSSRGLTWETSFGMGRPKPDIVTFGEEVRGVSLEGGCEIRSGTSVSTGIVSGVLGFFLKRKGKRGGGRETRGLKIVAIESAQRIGGVGGIEQGAGRMDIDMLEKKWDEEGVKVFPKEIEIVGGEDGMFPLSMLQLYEGRRPIKFNLTLISDRRISQFPKNPNFTYAFEGNFSGTRPRLNITIESHQSSAFFLLLSLYISLLPSSHPHSYLHSNPSVSSPYYTSLVLTLDLSSSFFSSSSSFSSPSSSSLQIPIKFE